MKLPARWLLVGAVGMMIVGLIGLMAWGLMNKSPVTSRSGITRVQQPAPDFTLALFDGSELSLSELSGRPVVLNFWASWCPPCREESHELERTWRANRANDVWFVGLDIQDTDKEATAYLKEFGITYPNGRDVDGKITVDYGVIGLPTTFFVNRKGIVERRWVGAIDENRLAAWIDDLTAGTPPKGDTEGENLDSYFQLGQTP